MDIERFTKNRNHLNHIYCSGLKMAIASEGELENMILSTPFAPLNLFITISGSKIK